MAKMIPPIIDPDVKSSAERTIYKWLEDLKWKNCVVLHSLGIAHHEKNIFGEIDFVVISTEGILCIEVKGGQVYRKDGIWCFKNRFGQENTKNTGPFEQAQGNMQSLRGELQKRLNKGDLISRCQYACCVMTPDCCINETGLDIIPEVLFDGKQTKEDIIQFFDDSFSYWRNVCMTKHGFEGGKLSLSDIDRVVDLLRGDFKFVPALSVILNRTDEQLLSVTDEQYSIMEGCEENDRLLISGAAGTGKTLLAMEQCRRLSAAGKKVLYLCYNRLIASYVKECRDQEKGKYDVYNLHQLLIEECNDLSIPALGCDFFEKELPNIFIERNEIGQINRKYDAVIIDEGQDLMNTYYYMCIGYLLKDGFAEGTWSVYFDPSQNLFIDNKDFEDIWKQLKMDAETSYKLTINCRNTRQIAVANKMISNIEQAKQLRADGTDVVYECFSSIHDEQKKLIKIIRNLRSQGVSAKDIVILSPYSDKSCICEMQIPSDIGPIRINPKMNVFRRESTDFYTIQSFKGLESKVVILIDIDNFESEMSRLLNYVAVSRARTMLQILYAENAEMERQKMLIQGALMK
ncbi:MAG: NERD domain-containing protein [Lachnospiraceae bacterium]|nr:NERD domain-containing protein [Lachnospiraceae bacterium]